MTRIILPADAQTFERLRAEAARAAGKPSAPKSPYRGNLYGHRRD